MIPVGYSKLPDGVVCKCFKMWREADGSHWCCLPQPGTVISPDDLTELVAAAIAKAGFPRSRESAREYRLRLARAALREVSKYEARNRPVGRRCTHE